MPLHSKQTLREKLSDPAYREAFVSSRIAQTVATQIKVMRQARDLSQKDLARELGTSQNAIYRLENPKYGRPNISTLKKVAEFFKVGLIVRFAAFSELVDWSLNLSQESFKIPAIEDDMGFVERKDNPESEIAVDSLRALAAADIYCAAPVRLQSIEGTSSGAIQTINARGAGVISIGSPRSRRTRSRINAKRDHYGRENQRPFRARA
jgi:transcriptional regulator with XRE-family HTH domain